MSIFIVQKFWSISSQPCVRVRVSERTNGRERESQRQTDRQTEKQRVMFSYV